MASPCAFKILNTVCYPQGLERHLFGSWTECLALQPNKWWRHSWWSLRSAQSSAAWHPVGSCFMRWSGGLGGPGQKASNTKDSGLRPASARGFPALADTGPPGGFRPDRSRWQTWLMRQWSGQQIGPPISAKKIWNQFYLFFSQWHMLSGEFLVYLGGNIFLQKNVINHRSSWGREERMSGGHLVGIRSVHFLNVAQLEFQIFFKVV